MTRRITKSLIRERVAQLQERGVDIQIDSVYGQYRFENRRGDHLSWRLPPGQLSLWLDGYEAALRMMGEKVVRRVLGGVIALPKLMTDATGEETQC